jgi:hypothetical protein
MGLYENDNILRDLMNQTKMQYVPFVIHHMYKNKYACISYDTRTIYYHFHNHRWQEDPGWDSLREKISTEVTNEYLKASDIVNTQATTEHGLTNAERRRLQAKSRALLDIAVKLRTVPSNIINRCKGFFSRSFHEFYCRLDTNKHLIAFNDGILDLTTNEFRPGRPEDLITFSTNYDYPRTSHQPTRDKLNSFLSSITSSEDVKQYILDNLAYTCHGYEHMGVNSFWCGSDDDGKTALKNLCMKTFGDYAYESTTRLSRREVMKLKGKRFVCMSKPFDRDKLYLIRRMIVKSNINTKVSPIMSFMPLCSLVVLRDDKPTQQEFCLYAHLMDIVDFPSNPLNIELPLEPNYCQEFMLMLLEKYQRVKALRMLPRPPKIESNTSQYMDVANRTLD